MAKLPSMHTCTQVTAPAFTVTPTFVSSTGASLPKDDEDNDNAYATQHLKLSASSESTTEGRRLGAVPI